MKLTSAAITILIGREATTIEVYDKTSARQVIEITLTPEQLSSALSRLSHTPCEVSVFNTDKINKIHEVDKMEFEIEDSVERQRDSEYLFDLAKKRCPEGWMPENYFGSQNSFFTKDGKRFARTNIHRWVEQTEETE